MTTRKTNGITAAVFFAVLLLHFFAVAVTFLHVSIEKPQTVQTQFVMQGIPKPITPAAPPRSRSPKQPAKPKNTKKPQSTPAPAALKQSAEEQPQEPAETQEPQTEDTDQTDAAEEAGAIAETGDTTGSGTNTAQIDFKQIILQRIAEKKIYPKAARKRNQEGSVTIEIVVLQSGQLAHAQIISPCSYKFLNEAALASVRAAAPFPLDNTAPEKIELTVTLEYRLEE